MARRNLGTYRIGQQVSVMGHEGLWVIAGFPSRRLVVIRRENGGGANSVTTVSINDLVESSSTPAGAST